MSKLKKCPFCENEGDSLTGVYVCNNEISSPRPHGCYVECDRCQAQGPWFPVGQIKQAIAGWNARSDKAFDKVE